VQPEVSQPHTGAMAITKVLLTIHACMGFWETGVRMTGSQDPCVTVGDVLHALLNVTAGRQMPPPLGRFKQR